ncbi:MAG: L-ribulokinase [Spirochaetes bacterium]|nr:MAG: L-ribulokinase [Spirochaetota bacterium]
MSEVLVLGIDYGTDSCRVAALDARTGKTAGEAVAAYPRWAAGLYCSPSENIFRQHPLDYLESLEAGMRGLSAALEAKGCGAKGLEAVAGIAFATTGSTPCLVDSRGMPLAMSAEFAQDPDGMFVLWKDHSAIAEAEEINRLSRSWGGEDFTKFSGGSYSPEWFWAKALHLVRANPRVGSAFHSILEHCDWMPLLLTETPLAMAKRSRCVAGHKAMWHERFGGFPSKSFLGFLDPRLAEARDTLGSGTFTADQVFGLLSPVWASRLGLKPGIPVAVGAIDAHIGAVGSGAGPGVLVKVMGTSTCDMIVAPKEGGGERLVQGICGQVDGSILPGMLGYEAGQSAFGDAYAWFKNLLSWPIEAILPEAEGVKEKIDASIMNVLGEEAGKIDPERSSVLALDWLNGRRTPDLAPFLKGALVGLTLGATAPMIFRALVEATAYGTRAIVERFEAQGVAIQGILALGGVARKSPLVMQIVADVLGRPIGIVGSDQTVALGAAMFAAVAAGVYPDIGQAQKALKPSIEHIVQPNPARGVVYDRLYAEYLELGRYAESLEARRP